MAKAKSKLLANKYIVLALIFIVGASVILNLWLLIQDNTVTKNIDDSRSNEQVVRDMLTYEASYAGLTLKQAEEKAKSDNILPKVGKREGEPVAHPDMRIAPPGSVVAYFDLIYNGKNEIVQGVDFWGEVSHFKYLDILRSKGQAAAYEYAKKHNLH